MLLPVPSLAGWKITGRADLLFSIDAMEFAAGEKLRPALRRGQLELTAEDAGHRVVVLNREMVAGERSR